MIKLISTIKENVIKFITQGEYLMTIKGFLLKTWGNSNVYIEKYEKIQPQIIIKYHFLTDGVISTCTSPYKFAELVITFLLLKISPLNIFPLFILWSILFSGITRPDHVEYKYKNTTGFTSDFINEHWAINKYRLNINTI